MRNILIMVSLGVILFFMITCNPTGVTITTEKTKYDYNEPPGVVIKSHTDGAFVSGILTISGEASDDKGIEKIEVAFGIGTNFKTAYMTTVNNITSWDATFDTTTVADTSLYIQVRATDIKNAVNFDFKTVIVDNQGPTVTVINPAVDQAVSGYVPIIGTGNKVDYVEVSVNGGSYQAATGSTVWTYALSTFDMSEDIHYLSVRGGRTSPAVVGTPVNVSFRVDKTIPSILFDTSGSNPGPGSYLKDTVIFYGTASDTNGINRIEVSTNNGLSYSPANGTTSWNFSLDTTTLPDSARTIIARALDNTGLLGTISIPVIIDNNIPTITINTPASSYIANSTINFTGTASDGVGVQKVELQFGTHSFTAVQGTTIWNYDYNIASDTNGSYNITVRVTDYAGNVNQANMTIIIDKNNPTFGTTTGIANNGYYKDVINISGTVNDLDSGDTIASVKVKYNNDSFADVDSFTAGTGDWSHSVDTDLTTDGAKTITFRVTDQWGGYSDQIFNVTYDNTAPAVSFTQPDNSTDVGGKILVTGTATDAGGVQNLQLRIDNDGNLSVYELDQNITSSISNNLFSYLWNTDALPFSVGLHPMRLEITDKAGNTNYTEIIVNKTNDIPTIAITSPTNGSYQKGTVSVTGTAGATGGVTDVKLKIDSGIFVDATDTSSGDPWATWQFDINTKILSEGSHTLTAQVTASTVTNASQIQITVDNTPPVINITYPTSANQDSDALYGSITIEGNATDTNLSTVQVNIDGAGYITPTGTTSWTQAWNTTSVTGSAKDDVVILARATDNAGNQTVTDVTVDVHPYITALSKQAAVIGNSITITGYNFTAGSTIEFDGAAPVANSGATPPSSLTVTIPSGATSGNVYVYTNGKKSNGVNINIWSVSTISGTSGGTYPSIVRDASNNLYLGFTIPGGTKQSDFVKYISGSGWQGVVQLEATGTGAGPIYTGTAIAGSTGQNVYVAYYHDKNDTLKIAKSTNYGSSFGTPAIIASGTYSYLSLAGYYNGTNDELYLAYYDSSTANLVLSKSSNGGTDWDTPINVDSVGDVGKYASVALDTSHNPCIAFNDATNKDLKFAYYNGSTWTVKTLDGTGGANVGEYCKLKIGTDNSVHISYFDGNAGDCKYIYSSSPSSTFDLPEKADEEGLSGWYSSIALDSNNKPHIAFYDFTNNSIKYSFKTGTAWEGYLAPDTPTYPNTFLDIVMDSTNKQWIIYPTGSGLNCANFIP